MFRLQQRITINDSAVYNFLTELEVRSTWQTFTDTATVVFPQNNITQADDENIFIGDNPIFKRGDRIKIEIGYFGRDINTLNTVFEGYITQIIPDYPVSMLCQDASWLLKQGEVKLNYASVSLKELVEEGIRQVKATSKYADEIDKIGIIVPDADLGAFRTEGDRAVNFVQILNEIKKVYKLESYIQRGDLYVSFGGSRIRDNRVFNTHEIIFERNVISHNLIYQVKDDVRLGVRAVAMYPNNTKLETQVGDTDGAYITLSFYNVGAGLGSDSERIALLEQYANGELEKAKYDGYIGDFLTFGTPFMEHGDRVDLSNKRIPERDGGYVVDEVVTTFGQGGYRQNVRLGFRITA